MFVGLPGAGISAFFYLLLVLLMPIKLAWQAVRRTGVRPGHLRLTARQMVIGAGIVGSFAVIGWVLSAVLPEATHTSSGGGAVAAAAVAVERGATRVGIYIGIATLVAVLVATQILKMTVKRRPVQVPRRRRG